LNEFAPPRQLNRWAFSLGMNKITIACFSIVWLLVSCSASFGCPVGSDCRATEITIDSFGISTRIVLVERGRRRPAGHVDVDAFYFRQGEWQPIGSVSSVGGFGWKADEVGRYKFVVRREGVNAATLILNVRSLRGKWNEFIIPLKADGCARARLIRAGVT
jgi:hypothetical protein